MFTKKEHPLGWSEKEIQWLASCGLDYANIYRAMGYKLKPRNNVPLAFKQRVDALRGKG